MKKIYLDTSTVRKYSNELYKFKGKAVFTSSLVVFELIAGMNEKEFYLRKNVLCNLLKSKISIDWCSYKMKMHKAFKIKYYDVEGKSIKKFASEIIKCENYNELKAIKVYFRKNEYYKLESFEEFDKGIEQVGKRFSSLGVEEWRKIEKNERRDIKIQMRDLLCLYSMKLSKKALINLVQDFVAHSNRPSNNQYVKVLKKYDKSLDMYLYYNQMFFLLKEINGSACGRNDTLDLLHIIYLKKNDTIISEDKIFSELCEYSKLINTRRG